VHGASTGIDASICASNRITALISAADPSDAGGPSNQAFLLQEIVGLRKALLAAKTLKPGRAAQKIEHARQVLSVFVKIVRRGDKRDKINGDLAAQILDLALNAKGNLPLRTKKH
jgi:hypothetical protein